MEESNPFAKKHVEEVTAAQRTILDELNLPPAAKNFLRENSRLLLISFLVIVGAICAWSYYSYYIDSRNDRAARHLAQAMLITEPDQKREALQKVSADFSATGSALWAQFAVAADHLKRQEYDRALPVLTAMHGKVSSENPLFPLLQQFSGAAHELSGDLEAALHFYQTLSSLPGFSGLGYIEEGRVHERQNQAAQAKDAYEKALTAKGISAEQRAWLQEKVSSL